MLSNRDFFWDLLDCLKLILLFYKICFGDSIEKVMILAFLVYIIVSWCDCNNILRTMDVLYF